jgi:hypothetical protein
MRRVVRAGALLEVLMSSVNLNRVPVELGWAVAKAYLERGLSTRDGFRVLVKACRLCEPEKTSKVLRGEMV